MYLILDTAADEFSAAATSTAGFASGVSSLVVTDGEKISDRYDYLGEDLTRMAMDSLGFARVPGARLFGAIDYKAARLLTHSDFSIDQALFVDSKAEKNAYSNCRIQITQTSMTVRQVRQQEHINKPGLIDKIWVTPTNRFLSTTVFVKYHYKTDPIPELSQVTIVCLPHGFLQQRYNPSVYDTIFSVGPDSPKLKEKFRTRIHFESLENKAPWRVQRMWPGEPWKFNDEIDKKKRPR